MYIYSFAEDHKVIEIIVHDVGDIERLYKSPDGVFLRRDGSVQTLAASEVEEWYIQVFNKHELLINQKHKNFVIPAHFLLS